MAGQLVIKIVLLLIFAFFAWILLFPGRSTRHNAMRRVTLGLVVAVGIVSILFPDLLTWVAHLVGIGRGADLLLYVVTVAFLGQLIRARSNDRQIMRHITDLARHVALLEAPPAPVAARELLASRPPRDERPQA